MTSVESDYRKFWSYKDESRYQRLDGPSQESPGQEKEVQIAGTSAEPRYKLAFCTVLLLYIISILVVIFKEPGFIFKLRNPLRSTENLPGSAFMPDLLPQTVYFQRNISFHNRDVWERFAPSDLGYVTISNPSQFGLERGWPVKEGLSEAYGIAMFHQLHCLVRSPASMTQTT